MKPDELSHLQPPCRDAALLSNDERIHWLRQERWIQYPRAERILERLLDLVDYPPRDRMPCLVIYGATGMGKTRIIQKFLRENRSHFDRKLGRTRVPVVSIQMPQETGIRDRRSLWYRPFHPLSNHLQACGLSRFYFRGGWTIIARRFVKKQQMQWTLRRAHLLLQTRTKVLNDELEEVFRRWYPRFRPKAA